MPVGAIDERRVKRPRKVLGRLRKAARDQERFGAARHLAERRLDLTTRIPEALGDSAFALFGAEVREILGQDHELCALAARGTDEFPALFEIVRYGILARELNGRDAKCFG